MTSLAEAWGAAAVMGAVILFCRAFPFLFFPGGKGGEREKAAAAENSPEAAEGEKAGGGRRAALLGFVEKTVPPVAMTALAFNALGGAFRENPRDGVIALAASLFTAGVHLWKRNSLASIFGGTALYMILTRIFP